MVVENMTYLQFLKVMWTQFAGALGNFTTWC